MQVSTAAAIVEQQFCLRSDRGSIRNCKPSFQSPHGAACCAPGGWSGCVCFDVRRHNVSCGWQIKCAPVVQIRIRAISQCVSLYGLASRNGRSMVPCSRKYRHQYIAGQSFNLRCDTGGRCRQQLVNVAIRASVGNHSEYNTLASVSRSLASQCVE